MTGKDKMNKFDKIYSQMVIKNKNKKHLIKEAVTNESLLNEPADPAVIEFKNKCLDVMQKETRFFPECKLEMYKDEVDVCFVWPDHYDTHQNHLGRYDRVLVASIFERFLGLIGFYQKYDIVESGWFGVLSDTFIIKIKDVTKINSIKNIKDYPAFGKYFDD